MAELTVTREWVFTSTGTGKALGDPGGFSQAYTWEIATSSGCTAVVQIQTHQRQSSAGTDTNGGDIRFGVISTIVSTLADVQTAQFLGPLKWQRPRVTDKTAGATNVITITVRGNG